MSAIDDYTAAVLALSPAGYWDCQDAGSPLNDQGSSGQDFTKVGGGTVTYEEEIGPATGTKSIDLSGSGGCKFDAAGSVTAVTDNFTLGTWLYVNNFNFDESGASGFGVLWESSGISWLLSGSSPSFGQPAQRIGGVWSASFQGFAGTTLSALTWYFHVLRRESGVWKQFLNGALDASPGVSAGSPTGTPSIGRAGKWNVWGQFVIPSVVSDGDILDLYNIGIEAGPPVNTVPPVVSGSASIGSTLTVSDGTWSGGTTGFTYQWQSSLTGQGGWGDLVGETSNALFLDEGLDNMFLRCVVVASNSIGDSDPVNSNIVGPVQGYPNIYTFSIVG